MLLILCGLAIPAAAMARNAKLPTASTSTVPHCIPLVGCNGARTQADPAGEFTMTMRDVGNNPIADIDVKIDFSACSDIHIADQASQLGGPGVSAMTVDCVNHTISALTNAYGVVTFRIIGAASNAGGNQPGAGHGCAVVTGGYAYLGTITVTAYNQDGSTGASGVGGNDLSCWMGDFFAAVDRGRSDFDCSGGIPGGNDLSLWLGAFFTGKSACGATAQCP